MTHPTIVEFMVKDRQRTFRAEAAADRRAAKAARAARKHARRG